MPKDESEHIGLGWDHPHKDGGVCAHVELDGREVKAQGANREEAIKNAITKFHAGAELIEIIVGDNIVRTSVLEKRPLVN